MVFEVFLLLVLILIALFPLFVAQVPVKYNHQDKLEASIGG